MGKIVKRGFWDRFLTFRKGDFQTRDRKGTQPIGGGSSHPKVTTSCHTRYRRNSPNYCMNDFDNDNYCPFRNARWIAVNATLCPNAGTTIYRPQKRQSHIITLPFSFSLLLPISSLQPAVIIAQDEDDIRLLLRRGSVNLVNKGQYNKGCCPQGP